MNSPLETVGIDTRLARALLEAGRVDHPTLLGLLEEVRGQRGGGESSRTLARSLSERGLLPESELEGWVVRLAGASNAGWGVGGQVAGVEILGALGSGGMGTVHLARDLQTGAEVAVKTLTLGEDQELQIRFEREAEAQARVGGHPNVIPVHRYGVAQGRAFLVMDVARGGDLGAVIRRGPLAPREAAEIARALAGGLAHSHARGVLHRDLKPANVLFDEQGAPRLTDFGLARLAGAEDLTQTGQILGTPAYMAPEQALAGVVDERTDVYGLGAILFATLTGRAPFVGLGVFALLASVSEGGAPAVRWLNREVPEDLGRICDRCLAKNPAERYPSAQALEEALGDFLSGRSSRGSRGRSFALASAVCVAAGLLLGALALDSGVDSPEESPATTSGGEIALAEPAETRPGALGSEELKQLREKLARAAPVARAEEVERALARGGPPPTWLREISQAPFLTLSGEAEAQGVTDVEDGAFLVWTDSETRLYDVWNTGRPRWTWPGRWRATSSDRSRALLVEERVARLIDLSNGGVLGSWKLPNGGVRRARFLGPRHALFAVNHAGGAKVLRLDFASERTEPLWFFEGLKDFVLTQDSFVFGYDFASGEGGLAARSLTDLGGSDQWRLPSVGDGAPTLLSLSPLGDRVVMGTLAGRVQVAPTQGPPPGGKPLALRLDEPGGVGLAQRERVGKIAWPRQGLLLVQGDELHVWRERASTWTRELSIDLGGLEAFDLSRDGRRLLSLSQDKVTQRLLSGHLPELARATPLFETSGRARAVLAYARSRARGGADEQDLERARAGMRFALESLTLSPDLRAKVEDWLGKLGRRREYEGQQRGSFEKGGSLAEDAGALDEALMRYQADVRERPRDLNAHYRVARVLGLLGDLESASRYLGQAEALIPEGLTEAGLRKRCGKLRRRLSEDRERVQSAREHFTDWD